MKHKNLIPILALVCIMGSCDRIKQPVEFQTAYDQSWQVENPVKFGFYPGHLADAYAACEKLGYVDALLIQRDSVLVAEKYYNGYHADKAHVVMSISKSFLSAMIGIAVRDGLLTTDQYMMDYFPEYQSVGLDPLKYNIRLDHLLTMSAGYAHDETIYDQVFKSSLWIRTTIELPLQFPPGAQFSYNTFESHLLSVILTRSSRMSSLNFANTFLLQPMGFTCQKWDQDPQGYYFGGNKMYFKPRELLKFGYLYLQEGRWQQVQVVPSDWVRLSWQLHKGGTWEWGAAKQMGYGYYWWLGTLNGHLFKMALGYGGQYILIFPELKLLVATTCNPNFDWDLADQHERAVLGIIAQHILTSLR